MVTTPKALGVIGGMGPLATQLFYEKVIENTDASCDQEHIPMILLNHCTMPDRTHAILSGNTDEVYSLLLRDAQFLQDNGCSAIAIPCNTSHYFVDRMQDELTVPIVNMVRETVMRAKNSGRKKVGILATDGTLQTGIYQKEMELCGLSPVVPTGEIQKLVMSIIYDDIKQGKPGNSCSFQKINDFLKEQGCDCGILACTELSCFAQQQSLGNFYLDAMDVLVDKVIEICDAKRRTGKHGTSAV